MQRVSVESDCPLTHGNIFKDQSPNLKKNPVFFAHSICKSCFLFDGPFQLVGLKLLCKMVHLA